MKIIKIVYPGFSTKQHRHFFIRLLLLSFFTGIFSFVAGAQYFYKDIWTTNQLINEYSILKNENFKTIKIKSFEDDGEPSQGFFCEKKVNKNFTQSQMISRSNITGQSLLVSDYDIKGRPIKTINTTPTTTSSTQYEYDDSNRLKKVQTITKADEDLGEITETHEYSYLGNTPVSMLRKKNNSPISMIHFVTDSIGNVIEENAVGSTNVDKKFFYYYDDKNRLTDVVHFNETAGRLLPDYMYEYNTSNSVQQMISTEEGGGNYFIWRYSYNDKNLRETERCFSKEKRLLGTIRYEYN